MRTDDYPIVGSSDLYDDYIDQQGDDLLKWQLEPKSVLDELEFHLRGLRYIEGKGPVKVLKEPLISKEGIGKIMFALRTQLNHNNVQAVLQKGEPEKFALKIGEMINRMLFYNYELWKLTPETWDLIITTLPSKIYMFLTRPVGGQERILNKGMSGLGSWFNRPRNKQGMFQSRNPDYSAQNNQAEDYADYGTN